MMIFEKNKGKKSMENSKSESQNNENFSEFVMGKTENREKTQWVKKITKKKPKKTKEKLG